MPARTPAAEVVKSITKSDIDAKTAQTGCKPVFVLMRTSGRPSFYATCMESISRQDYPHIITIVHKDSRNDLYCHDADIVLYSDRIEANGPGHYNLYCNKLLQAIPDIADGWYHFIDDDDAYSTDDVISQLVAMSDRDKINVGKSQRADNVIYPARWGGDQDSFQTECFFLHLSHRNKAHWPHTRGGDHYYSKQLTAMMPINWIDLLICKAQAGKGYGLRMDYHEQTQYYRKKGITYRCGARGSNAGCDFVLYLTNVPGRADCAGQRGQTRWIRKGYSEQLLAAGKIEILQTGENNA